MHRDLKPSNVMICKVAQEHDFVKVLDFGLAKSSGARRSVAPDRRGRHRRHARLHGAGSGAGQPDVDARADLYALGCVGYVLLTGTLVFPDSNPMSMALKHVQAAAGSAVAAHGAADSRRISSASSCNASRRTRQTVPSSASDLDERLMNCGAPEWTERDAANWWQHHLPQTSSLRSFAQTPMRTPPVVQKV